MTPILYRPDETLFTSNGVGRLPDCVSCVVTEERNGIYECEFQYPVTGRLYNLIKPGMIIAVTHDNNHDVQPFDIYAYTAPIDGIVTFYAHHISYRLSNIILKPFSANNCAEALQRMQTRVYNNNPFTFWTDKDVDGVWTNPVPASIKARLVGESGSILDVYGKGEYEFDKWAVKLHANRGHDTGVDIRYGVNLSDFEQEINDGASYTAVAPYWQSTDGTQVITLPEGYVTADQIPVELMPWTTNTGEYVRDNNGEIIYFNVPNIKPVPLDLSAEFQTVPTVEQLRSLAKSRLNSSSAWLPDENITIDFVDLSGTYDGIDIAALRPVTLCDRVNVYCGPLNVAAAEIQCVRLVYDVLNERNARLELGTVRPTYSQTLKDSLSGNMVSKSQADALITTALDSATQQITGATNSHVKFVYDDNGGLQEILIMDTDDIETAQRIWRWNSGGLGFSSTGYGGPYGLAMTQDGAIVANFIKTGTLTADLIKTGILQAANGNQSNLWNMLTGEFSLKSDGATNGIEYKNGALHINASNIDVGTLSANLIKAGILQDAAGKSYWNMLTGVMNIVGTFAASTVDTYGDTYTIKLINDTLQLLKNGLLQVTIGWNEPVGAGIHANNSGTVTLDAVETNAANEIIGGAYVQAYKDGRLYLIGDTVYVGAADDLPVTGLSGTYTIGSRTITLVNGFITSIT